MNAVCPSGVKRARDSGMMLRPFSTGSTTFHRKTPEVLTAAKNPGCPYVTMPPTKIRSLIGLTIGAKRMPLSVYCQRTDEPGLKEYRLARFRPS